MPAPFAWTPALSVGVEVVDGQHRELFARAGALVAAADAHDPLLLMKTLAFLGDYVVAHFAAEEALMVERGYPGVRDHAAEHERFTRTFARLRSEFARAGADAPLAEAVRREICDWLVDHVLQTDGQFGAFVRGAA